MYLLSFYTSYLFISCEITFYIMSFLLDSTATHTYIVCFEKCSLLDKFKLWK